MTYDVVVAGALVIIGVCLLISALTSAAETAITSMTKLRIKRMIEDHGAAALLLEKITQKWDNILITLLITNTAVNILAASLATIVTARVWGDHEMGEVAAVATVITTLAMLVFCEIIPKTLAKRYAEPFALRTAWMLEKLSKLLSPFVYFFKFISLGIMRILGAKIDDAQHILTEQEIVAIVEAGEREGVIEEEEGDMIRGVIEFGDTFVHEVMVPRVDMVTIDSRRLLSDAIELLTRNIVYSRIPVIKDSVDNVVGILHVKDIMKYVNDPSFHQICVLDICRKPFFVPEKCKLDDVLQSFRKERMHMGIVIDEYGGTAGLVTIEDLLEEIVGDILDEHDGEKILVRRIGDRVAIVDAKINIAELNEILGVKIPEQKDYDSLGGFLTYITEHLPEKGSVVSYENLVFQILEADHKRVYKVKLDIKEILPMPTPADESEDSEE